MVLWILSQPPEQADPTELSVAERLNELRDDWIICWGYRYGTNGGTDPDCEGDFVIQGPRGHVCAIEVKAGQLRNFALTGRWEHEGHGHPADQLHRERKGVMSLMKEAAGGGRIPNVAMALALPNVNFVKGDQYRGQLKRAQLIDKGDLDDFPAWWTRHVAPKKLPISSRVAREQFLQAFGSRVAPKAIRFFTTETDRLIVRQLESESLILDAVAQNEQLLVEGGCGSGKSFMAMEQARRWAEADGGQRVLLLAYNLKLCEQLTEVVKRRPPTRGEILVRSWEAIARELLKVVDIDDDVPEEKSERSKYFIEEVPGLLLEILKDGGISPEYDALVADEGQDLDTCFPAELSAEDQPGWWVFCLALLRRGDNSRIAIFYDPAQRPNFRNRDGFSVERLLSAFSQPARLRLPRSLRYTRPLYEFLKNLTIPESPLYGASLASQGQDREGLDVKTHDTASEEESIQQVTAIVADWTTKGLCRAHEILILGFHRDRKRTSLGDTTALGNIPLCDYSISSSPGSIAYLNIHRSKGLDKLAIILIDMPPWEELVRKKDHDNLQAYFAGASRARQLLAVVHQPDPA